MQTTKAKLTHETEPTFTLEGRVIDGLPEPFYYLNTQVKVDELEEVIDDMMTHGRTIKTTQGYFDILIDEHDTDIYLESVDVTLKPSRVLKATDPKAYDESFFNWLSYEIEHEIVERLMEDNEYTVSSYTGSYIITMTENPRGEL